MAFPEARRDNAFDEVVHPLEVAALSNGQLATRPQRIRHPFGDLEVPPAAAAGSFHIEGAKRSLLAQPLPQRCRHLRVLLSAITLPEVAVA